MKKEQIEQIRELAKRYDFHGVPIPQLCDLAILGAVIRDVWFMEYFQGDYEEMRKAHEALLAAKRDYIEAEAKKDDGDFEQRYPGILR